MARHVSIVALLGLVTSPGVAAAQIPPPPAPVALPPPGTPPSSPEPAPYPAVLSQRPLTMPRGFEVEGSLGVPLGDGIDAFEIALFGLQLRWGTRLGGDPWEFRFRTDFALLRPDEVSVLRSFGLEALYKLGPGIAGMAVLARVPFEVGVDPPIEYKGSYAYKQIFNEQVALIVEPAVSLLLIFGDSDPLTMDDDTYSSLGFSGRTEAQYNLDDAIAIRAGGTIGVPLSKADGFNIVFNGYAEASYSLQAVDLFARGEIDQYLSDESVVIGTVGARARIFY